MLYKKTPKSFHFKILKKSDVVEKNLKISIMKLHYCNMKVQKCKVLIKSFRAKTKNGHF